MRDRLARDCRSISPTASDVWSHDVQEIIGKDWLPEKRRCGEVCRDLARIAPRDKNERDMAVRQLRRDRKRDPVSDLYVQDPEVNVSVEQLHRARYATSGRRAAVEIILHQPRHGVSNEGVIFNNEDAFLHKRPTRRSAHRSRGTPTGGWVGGVGAPAAREPGDKFGLVPNAVLKTALSERCRCRQDRTRVGCSYGDRQGT